MTTDQDNQTYWKRCSSCKNEIDFTTTYWVCSVSTCTRKRTGMVFCSVGCWEMHRPMMRHREDYAVEERSPSRALWIREQAEERAASAAASTAATGSAVADSARAASSTDPVRRRVVAAPATASAPATGEPLLADDDEIERDVLVVASKLKKYVRARAGMNTSDGVISILSDHLRAICDQAIRTAAQDGRKTVLDRDVPRPPSRSS